MKSDEDFNEDEYEEIEEDEEDEIIEKPEEQRKEPEEEEEKQEETKKPNNFQAINKERNINKKANAIRYFIHFSNNTNKTYDTVALETGLTKAVAEKYLKEFASVVTTALQNKTYPTSVLLHYNDVSIPKAQRLNVEHLQKLKAVMLRYYKVNVDSVLNDEEDEDEEISLPSVSNNMRRKAPPIIEEDKIIEGILNDDIIGEEDEGGGQYKKFNEFKSHQTVVNTNPKTISENSPIQDVIAFGLDNAGQPDAAKIRRIKALFMSSPNFYLSDEARFIELLESNDIKPKTLSTFMNWFKYIAPIAPHQRIGFLNLTGPKFNGNNNNNVPMSQQQKSPIKHFDINDYDEFAQFLYHEGVFRYGLTPDHPINQQAYQKYQEKKQLEEEDKEMMRRMNMMTKKWMMDVQMRGMGMMGGGNNGGGMQQQQGTMYDERYLFERGVVVPEISYDENGKRLTRWIPTGKPLYGNDFQNQNGQQPPKDNFTESVNMVTRLIEAVRPMLQQNQNGNGSMGNPMLDKLLTISIEKLLNKAEESPSKMLENQLGLFNQFKTFFPGNESRVKDPQTAQLELELAKIHQDGQLAEKEISIKEKHFELEQERLREQKNESKNSIEMIMDGVVKGFKYFEPLLGQLLMGQLGGGLSNMIPGGVGAPNGMMPPPPTAQPMDGIYVPPQQQEEEPEYIDEFNQRPTPHNIPREFMPQQYQEPPQQEFYSQQEPEPEPVYYQQPTTTQQYQPPPPPPQSQQEFYHQPPPPQPPQSENDFLNSITMDDLNTLSVNQLDDVESRIASKMTKFEKLYNSIKSTKAKKQFGYEVRKKPIIVEKDYSELDITDHPRDWDGIEEEEEEEEPIPQQKKQQFDYPVTPQQQYQEQQKGVDFDYNDMIPLQQQEDDDLEIEWVDTTTTTPTTDNYNNTPMDIDDMGNEINSREFIEKQEKIQAKRKKLEKVSKLQAQGFSHINENNVNQYNDKGELLHSKQEESNKVVEQQQKKASSEQQQEDKKVEQQQKKQEDVKPVSFVSNKVVSHDNNDDHHQHNKSFNNDEHNKDHHHQHNDDLFTNVNKKNNGNKSFDNNKKNKK